MLEAVRTKHEAIQECTLLTICHIATTVLFKLKKVSVLLTIDSHKQGWGVGVEESGHFGGFRSRSRQKLADSDSSKTLYCYFIKTIAGKVWFSSISRKFATEEEFIFNGKDAVCITRLPQQLDVRLYSSRSRAGRNESKKSFHRSKSRIEKIN